MCLELFKQKKPLLEKKECKMNSKDKYVHVFWNTLKNVYFEKYDDWKDKIY